MKVLKLFPKPCQKEGVESEKKNSIMLDTKIINNEGND